MTDDGFQFKTPPHSTEAEQSLLGALLLDNEAFDRVADLVTAEDFYSDSNRRIFRHIARLIETNKPADTLTVHESIEASDDRDKTGGPAYLGMMAQNTPSALNIRRYAELVRERSMQRRLAHVGTALSERALAGVEPSLEIADAAAADLMSLQARADRGGVTEFGVAMVEAVEWADNPKRGLTVGWPQLDGIVRGLMPGDLIVIAGRPSMGKTALAMNIAEHVAVKLPVAILSLEMTRRKIAARMLRYHESILGRDRAVDHLYGLKLYIDDSSSLTLPQTRSRLRRVKQQHGLALVVIDYLQLMTAKAEKRHEEVATISRGIKAIAKDLDVPIIAVAQLNRGAEGRPDNRPQLSDLRESGQIEQDADVVAFVYREEYYRPDTEWKGIAEVIVRKNRDGAIGTAFLEFTPEHTRFRALERELPRPPAPEPTAPRRTVVKADFKRAAAGDR